MKMPLFLSTPVTRCTFAAVVALLSALGLTPSGSLSAGLPDLTISRSGPLTVAVGQTFIERLTVTNRGTASTPAIQVGYSPGSPAVSGARAGVSCTAVLRGHSGRGGGFTRVGWACTASIKAGLQPGKSTVLPLMVTAERRGTVAEALVVQPWPSTAQLNHVSHGTTAQVAVIVPAAPAAPAINTVKQAGDHLIVSWTPDPATAKYITSSLITAAPTGSTGGVLTAAVAGPATTGAVMGVAPLTTYAVTVSNRDAGGAGPASSPITFTTRASTISPGAPALLRDWWANSNILAVSWQPGSEGDSPTDQYQVEAVAVDSDVNPPPAIGYVDGTTTSAYLSVDDSASWSIRVRAHDAAGWSPWSSALMLSGL